MQFLLNPKHSTFKILIFILIAVIGLVVYSCKHEDKGIAPLPDKVASAKAWYESVYPQMLSNTKGLVNQSINNQTDPSQIIKPDWKNAATYTRLGQSVIEMPVDPTMKLVLIFKTNTFAFNKDYSRSYYILLGDKQKYQAYILTFLADSTWVNNDLSKLAQNSYRKVAADFTGWVVYNTPKGEYLGGYGYKSGKLITPSTANTTSENPKVQSLDGGVLKPNNMVQVCTDNYYRLIYQNADGTESYGPWEYVDTTCTNVDDGGGTSGGGSGSGTGSTGGGSSSSPTPPPPKPCPPTSGTPTCTVPVADALRTNYVQPPTDPGAPPPPTSQPCVVPTVPCTDEDPCTQARALTTNTVFKAKMSDLQSKTGLAYEVGYTIDANGNYVAVQGAAGQASITLSPNTPLSGYIHSHYTGTFPTFSGSDILAIYQLQQMGKVADISTFTAGVVTASGTTYLMKISDPAKFAAFAANNLSTTTQFNNFELNYQNQELGYHIAGKDDTTAYELALLNMLQNSGITLMKGNNTFSSWNVDTITINNGVNDQIVTTICN